MTRLRGNLIALMLACAALVSSALAASANTPNAADEYRIALKHYAQVAMKGDLTSLATDAVVKGWPSGEQGAVLETVLAANAQALDALTRGASIATCDFYGGRNVLAVPTPNMRALKDLALLAGARARQEEAKGDEKAARRDWQTMLMVAQHMMYDRVLPFKGIGLNLEETAMTGLASPPHPWLAGWFKSHPLPPAERFASDEKKLYLDAVAQAVADDKTLGPLAISQAPSLANQYYDPLIKAMRTNTPADWKAASDNFEKLYAEMSRKYDTGEAKAILEKLKSQNLAPAAAALEIDRAMILMLWPNMNPIMRHYRALQQNIVKLGG